MSDDDELVAGSDPHDDMDVWDIDVITRMSPTSIGFDSVTGRLYSVEHNTDMAAIPQVWTEFTHNIPGTGSPLSIIDPDNAPNRNYRVRVSLPWSIKR